ncbi:ROK family transcriptional regulator [Alkalicoccus urumqiensis]|uniref:Sugar kinase n=1 Tax=Alkalicoccus urumqiensis TaxID=1548213 RepID=A0A2P6MI18_ALKUR|nr:ROK family transcriptional regulator [Alkalicoccus urumqiensis]PRO65931.1 sugar kinase [Alkalicoccus urumqiensis]
MKEQTSFSRMKSYNRSRILTAIRSRGPVSRAEVAKLTKLTPPTVTNLTAELIEENVIFESSSGISKGGRRPILLKIKADSRSIIGIDIGVQKVRLARTNLEAEVKERRLVEMPDSLDAASFSEWIGEVTEAFIREIPEEAPPLMGIGVAMHGIIDHETGTVEHAPSLGFRHVKLKQSLEKRTNQTVIVENDAKTMALGERWFGAGRSADTFLCLNIGEGIGGGCIIDDTLYHGADSLAAEIGHMAMERNGRMCSCGAVGCLQTLASGEALRYQAEKLAEAGTLKLAEDQRDGAGIFSAAENGDREAVNLLMEAGEELGRGLINAIHLLNPPLIILGGGVAKAEDYLLPAVKRVIEERALTERAAATTVVTAELKGEASLIGACTLILSRLYDPDVHE